MTSICIVAHNAFGVMCADQSKHVGGVEVQTRLLAEWLSKNGFDVTVITWNEGDPAQCELRGVRLKTLCSSDAGIPILRFVHPRWTSLNSALAESAADIYFQSGAEYCTGQIALWCRSHKKKFVFSVASDMDCVADLPLLRSFRERVLYRIGLKMADRIFSQTRNQQQLLKSEFGVASAFLPMPCKISADWLARQERRNTAGSVSVLMICRVSRVKNIEMYLEVARSLPKIEFVLVGPVDDDADYGQFVRDKVECLENAVWPGSASGQKLLDYYRNASVFCCTSRYEGFPNTFLEAWANGLPVVSTVDPDGIISERNLGAHVKTAVEMSEEISGLLESPKRLEELSENCTRYFRETHEPDVAIQRYADEFLELSCRD